MSDPGPGEVRVLRLPLSSRIGLTIGYLFVAIGEVLLSATTTVDQPFLAFLFALVVPLALWNAARVWLVRLELGEASLLVVNWYTSREVARKSVQSAVYGSVMPILRWTDGRGRKRLSLLAALQHSALSGPKVKDLAAQYRAALFAWIEKP